MWGVITSALSFYIGMAVLNIEVYGKTYLPLVRESPQRVAQRSAHSAPLCPCLPQHVGRAALALGSGPASLPYRLLSAPAAGSLAPPASPPKQSPLNPHTYSLSTCSSAAPPAPYPLPPAPPCSAAVGLPVQPQRPPAGRVRHPQGPGRCRGGLMRPAAPEGRRIWLAGVMDSIRWMRGPSPARPAAGVRLGQACAGPLTVPRQARGLGAGAGGHGGAGRSREAGGALFFVLRPSTG